MCDECEPSNSGILSDLRNRSRRTFLGNVLAVSAGLLAGPTMGVAAGKPTGKGEEFAAKAYGVTSPAGALLPINITRRSLGTKDILLDILYCGVCHSDIHTIRGEWGPIHPPCVPGHEIVGRVRAVGSAVTKFKQGDIAGVGCMVDSCGICENCKRGFEQYCLNHKTIFTYGSTDPGTGKPTLGGYSNKIVVTEKFAIRIPTDSDLASIAPLLCAGITTFSPMQYWKLEAGQRIGVVGLGGLGHMAVKLAAARKAEVIVFTTSPGKVADATRLGAKDAILSTNQDAMRKYRNALDMIISTAPRAYQMNPFLELLKFDGTLVNVGALEPLQGINGMTLADGRKRIAGSLIGGIAETQEVIDYCVSHNIRAEIELIRIQDIGKAIDRVVSKDVRYRFVIDMASIEKA